MDVSKWIAWKPFFLIIRGMHAWKFSMFSPWQHFHSLFFFFKSMGEFMYYISPAPASPPPSTWVFFFLDILLRYFCARRKAARWVLVLKKWHQKTTAVDKVAPTTMQPSHIRAHTKLQLHNTLGKIGGKWFHLWHSGCWENAWRAQIHHRAIHTCLKECSGLVGSNKVLMWL